LSIPPECGKTGLERISSLLATEADGSPDGLHRVVGPVQHNERVPVPVRRVISCSLECRDAESPAGSTAHRAADSLSEGPVRVPGVGRAVGLSDCVPFLVESVARAADGHNRAASWAAAAARSGQHLLSLAVKRNIPEHSRASPVLHRANEDVIHVPLDITPPIRSEFTRAFGKVDFFAGMRPVEILLLTDIASVAVESGTCKRIRGVVDLESKQG